jgi:uncharacterized RDD family membrane protein YckC
MSTQTPQGGPGQPPPVGGWTPPAPSQPPPAWTPPPAGAGYPPPGAGYPPPYPPTAPPGYPPGAYGQGWQTGPPPVQGVPPLPQGVVLAPVGRRIGAYFLSALLIIVTLVIGYIIWGLVLWGRGTSPAFSVLKMRCVRADNAQKATFGTMALRNILGGIAQSILTWITELVSLVLFLSRPDHRSLMDLIGGTVVVYDPQGVMGK